MVNEPGFTARAGGFNTLRVTWTACGLPTMVIPLFTAESEIEPEYVAAVSVAEVTFTVKVSFPPVATVAAAGETVNQPLPDARVTVGVMVTSPTQAPMMPTEKVCVAGSDPASVLKVSPLEEGV